MALIDLADLAGHVIGWQTLVGIPVSSRPWLRYQWLAQLGCHAIFWQSLVGLLLTGRAWFAMQYSAKLCLTSSLPTICSIPNYLHYSQLFALFPTIRNYSFQLFALFPTIHKYFQQANLSWHAMHEQTLVGIPVSSKPWLWDQWLA